MGFSGIPGTKMIFELVLFIMGVHPPITWGSERKPCDGKFDRLDLFSQQAST